MELLDEVKDFLNVEDNDEDMLISSLIKAAEAYLANAGATKPVNNENIELYNIAIKMVVGSMYENNKSEKPSYCLSIQSIITQLACSGGAHENKPKGT
ncbi:head-tail connector protein [Clostridium perfringens]|uniref:head-tail connector protein n=1 Tax=Clostridium perfringens TaxID=1502 RepID=UPI002244FEE3|nr:head-tail connector protein [Clostridium perfringens]MCX0403276.1 head-tail connector protein [Clostridium perfringens]